MIKTYMTMKPMNNIVRWYLMRNYPRIESFIRNPLEVQNELLRELVEFATFTEWGKKYNYTAIKNPSDFANNVPVGDYETHKTYIQRMMNGEADILWPGKIRWYSKSSGTTNDKSKYLPVSWVNLKKCHIQGNRDLMSLYFHNYPEGNLFEGKAIVMGGSHENYAPYPKTKLGDVSAIMIENMPFLFKNVFFTPSPDIALMSEWEAKIEKIAYTTINENITNIGGVPTWTLVLFRKILEITGKQNILEVWPNLEVYFHGGVSFEPYRAQFKEMLPSDDFHYFEVYNASEGYFAVQSDPTTKDMLLLLDNGIYYEFIPMDKWHTNNPKAIPLSEVELNKNYALVISTNSGLWRYQPGDTVMFTSLHPFKIKITGRTKHFINAFGEEVMVANTDLALSKTCDQFGAEVVDYTVAPVYFQDAHVSKGGHEWLIEFSKFPNSMEDFAEVLDKNLQQVNSDYEAKRYKNMALNRLLLRPMPVGTFHNWLKSKGRYGGQSKVPRLSNHRKYVEEILGFAGQGC